MNFRLIYRGHLPPDKRGVLSVKHRIRRELHPQLQVLWQTEPGLKRVWDPHSSPDPERGIDRLANAHRVGGFRFAPLVRVDQFACRLKILILRREDPHQLFTGTGDLDGRVKTLIDGLRMPGQFSELENHMPGADEDPFFCLLEDDRSIYEFSVETDRPLIPPDPNEPERDVVAVIEVNVTTLAGEQIARYSGGSFW